MIYVNTIGGVVKSRDGFRRTILKALKRPKTQMRIKGQVGRGQEVSINLSLSLCYIHLFFKTCRFICSVHILLCDVILKW